MEFTEQKLQSIFKLLKWVSLKDQDGPLFLVFSADSILAHILFLTYCKREEFSDATLNNNWNQSKLRKNEDCKSVQYILGMNW